MKRVLTGSLMLLCAVTVLGASAQAADLPVSKAPPLVMAPVYIWTGRYADTNIGAAWTPALRLRRNNSSEYSP